MRGGSPEPPSTGQPVDGAHDPDADVRSVARSIILSRLAERSRSRAELAEALERRHVPVDVATELLDGAERSGLIDDAAFARLWVEQRRRSKGLATKVLSMELRRKGVADEIVRDVLADTDPDVEREAAHELVQRKLRSMRGLDESTQVRRLTGMLARKGYAPQVAFDVVRAELEAESVPLDSL